MNKDFKKQAEEWAEKVLEDEGFKKELSEQQVELMTLGSLLFSVSDNGEKTWIKRLDSDTKFEIKPVKIIDGKIDL